MLVTYNLGKSLSIQRIFRRVLVSIVTEIAIFGDSMVVGARCGTPIVSTAVPLHARFPENVGQHLTEAYALQLFALGFQHTVQCRSARTCFRDTVL